MADWFGLVVQGIAICAAMGMPIGMALMKLSGRVTTLTEKFRNSKPDSAPMARACPRGVACMPSD